MLIKLLIIINLLLVSHINYSLDEYPCEIELTLINKEINIIELNNISKVDSIEVSFFMDKKVNVYFIYDEILNQSILNDLQNNSDSVTNNVTYFRKVYYNGNQINGLYIIISNSNNYTNLGLIKVSVYNFENVNDDSYLLLIVEIIIITIILFSCPLMIMIILIILLIKILKKINKK